MLQVFNLSSFALRNKSETLLFVRVLERHSTEKRSAQLWCDRIDVAPLWLRFGNADNHWLGNASRSPRTRECGFAAIAWIRGVVATTLALEGRRPGADPPTCISRLPSEAAAIDFTDAPFERRRVVHFEGAI
jgi:hypothetical protein